MLAAKIAVSVESMLFTSAVTGSKNCNRFIRSSFSSERLYSPLQASPRLLLFIHIRTSSVLFKFSVVFITLYSSSAWAGLSNASHTTVRP